MAEIIPFTLPETPTITEMDRLAEQVRAAVEAVSALIPRLERPRRRVIAFARIARCRASSSCQ